MSDPRLLRASHIKPWASCETDAERLDVYNGLLLAAHLDAAFDAGLISFTATGTILFSPAFDPVDRAALGINEGMLATVPDSLIGKRNRALILLGYAGALRRSELVGIDVSDLTFSADGIRLNIGRSKTDQEGGRTGDRHFLRGRSLPCARPRSMAAGPLASPRVPYSAA